MKKLIITIFALAMLATPAHAWYRGGYAYGGWGGGGWGRPVYNNYNYYGGWGGGYGGWNNYGAAMGVAAGAALLGGVIGGAIANQGYYGGYGYPAYSNCYTARVPSYDLYGNLVGYLPRTVC